MLSDVVARYFGLQNKPSSGAKKEKWVQIQGDRYIYGFWKAEIKRPVKITIEDCFWLAK